ncbi:MAG: serine/threonine protein kinase, partial [Phycisphaerales bacterium]|nr:serine/threonine protein kinase [Phycisphaerales bacterium]
HARVSALFLRARDLEPPLRRAFLESESADDPSLVAEVMSLFEADDPGFLTAPFAARPAYHDTPAMPQRIGSYEIRRVLGEGGMGIVYLAEQDRPRRTVALKVIRPLLASKRALQRFEHESQILARLKHPGIAQIYEAGVATTAFGAQPFFAMEYVDGEPLDRDVEKRRLSIRERLERMAQIADIVQHAHQQGVIHRDLKPANIMIDREGQPKVLDFGVARATDSDIQSATMQTDLGQLVGTVPYMSPEQVEGDPYNVDTRSDVYALGVITYRLLTGSHPYDLEHRTITEAVRLIRDTEPPSLGSVSRTMRGDVETIVAKALEKDRSRRYQSAAEFAGDIRRHLRDEPIVARPATTMYQLRKFARRHRPVVVSAALLLVVLLLGVATTTAGWMYALDQAAVAEREREAATEAQRESETARTLAERARADADAARLAAEEEARTATAARDFLKGMLRTL